MRNMIETTFGANSFTWQSGHPHILCVGAYQNTLVTYPVRVRVGENGCLGLFQFDW